MSTATIDWTEPTKRADGSALASSEIDGTEVSLGQNGVFSVLAKVAPGIPQTLTKNIPDGTYTLRHVVVDKAGRRSVAIDTAMTVKTVAAPGTVSGVKWVIT